MKFQHSVHLIVLAFSFLSAGVTFSQTVTDPGLETQNPLFPTQGQTCGEDKKPVKTIGDLIQDNPDILKSGGWSGNGGDFAQILDNPWFLGKETISYCVQKAEHVPFPLSQLESIVSHSIQQWHQFFKKYRMTEPVTANRRPTPNVTIQFKDQIDRGINFNFRLIQDCQQAKLAVLFGKENNVIKSYKKFNMEHPYGLAIRQQFNHSTYSNPGIVWIENLSHLKQVHLTLLHEFGHVFGMKHDSVYVMNANIAPFIAAEDPQKLHVGIESSYWPYRFKQGDQIALFPAKRSYRNLKRQTARTHCRFEQGQFLARHSGKTLNNFLPIQSNDCISIQLNSIKSEARLNTFRVKIVNHTNRSTATLEGQFPIKKVRVATSMAPALFTQYTMTTPKGTRHLWRSMSFDRHQNQELSGALKYNGGAQPAKITQEFGVALEFYHPTLNRWVAFKSY
jgi:hypothetical protein